MRFNITIWTIFLTTCFSESCDFISKSSDRKQTFTLSIAIDSSINSMSYYGRFILVSNHDSIKYDSELWDKKTMALTYKWDSLKAGDYQFKLNSVYHHQKAASFALLSDTIIKIRNDFPYQFVNIVSKKDLLHADTIDFAFESTGCSFTIEKYQLIKNNDKYRLIRQKNYRFDSIEKVVSPEIIDDLYLMQLNCRKYDIKEWRSTRAYQFIMIAGHKAFYFDDNYAVGSVFFVPFVEKYARN